MKIVVWGIVFVLIALFLYFGSQHDIRVKFLPEQQVESSQDNGPDTGIHDAVNFVKKPF